MALHAGEANTKRIERHTTSCQDCNVREYLENSGVEACSRGACASSCVSGVLIVVGGLHTCVFRYALE